MRLMLNSTRERGFRSYGAAGGIRTRATGPGSPGPNQARPLPPDIHFQKLGLKPFVSNLYEFGFCEKANETIL